MPDAPIIIVFVNDDSDFTATRKEAIIGRFPEVQFISFRTGVELFVALRGGLQPTVVIMDHDLSEANDWRPGSDYVSELKADYPEIVVIGLCGANNDTDLAQRKKAFLDAGADAFFSIEEGSGVLCDELENWLSQEELPKWRNWLALATLLAMTALLWVGLLTNPLIIFSFHTLPVGAVAFLCFTLLLRTGRVPREITVIGAGGALALTILGIFYYLAFTGAGLALGGGGGLLVGLLVYYLIFIRQ